jgi:hypothetical protein
MLDARKNEERDRPARREADTAREREVRVPAAVEDRGATHDLVYDASKDSFPASDAPAWTGITIGHAK